MKYFKLLIRHFLKQKTTGFLSIGSLALGITVAIITGLWCLNEWSFDKFHHQADNTYRITRKGFINGESVSLGAVCNPIGPELKDLIPAIKNVTRIYPLNDYLSVGQLTETVENVYAVDTNYHEILNYPLVQGSVADFVNKPNAIIINEDWAKKYFPKQNPIGQIVKLKGDKEIVGVMKNVPINSSFTIEAMIRIDDVTYLKNAKWGGNDSFVTFLTLNNNTNISELESYITAHAQEQFAPYKTVELTFHLQPLTQVRLGHTYRFDFVKNLNRNLVISFALMSLVVLIIGCINFTNLFISNSFLRAKSIGIKKTNGAKKSELIREFISETFIYSLIATLIAIILAELTLPFFSGIIGYNLSINFASPLFYAGLLIIILFTTIIAGSFPAFYMTHFNPIKTLKDQFKGNRVSLLQKGLLIFQLSASTILLISAITIKKQISHLQNMNLGFNKENIIHFEMSKSFRDNYDRFAQELKSNPDIIDISAKGCTPLNWNQGSSVSRVGKTGDDCLMEICYIKPNYFELVNMPIIKGHNLLGQNDSLKYCIVNEAAAKILGNDILDHRIKTTFRGEYIVKGIVKNAYTKSLHQKIDPQVYQLIPDNQYGVVMVKTRNNPQKAINHIQTLWNQETPNRPFEYLFLDDDYEQLYINESAMAKLSTMLMVVAFLITIAGLFGIARYSINRRIKEIGVRKVNGASDRDIITSLNSSFIKWVGVSFIVACPISWYLMQQWLNDFAVKTELSWWVFLLTGLCALLVTLLTVSIQSFKAANQNPVKCLRYE